MRKVPKFFNTAEPIKPDIHYNIDPLTRIDLEDLEMLIYQQKYFVLHAPRQTGKTSCLLALRDYLNARGEFYAVYANVEVGQASRNNVEEVNRNVVSMIATEASWVTGNSVPSDIRMAVIKEEAATNLLGSYLRRLCEALDRPLLLFIDEIDALVGDSLVSILRQLRTGYAARPAHFPQSIILCGVRDVRDCRIVLELKIKRGELATVIAKGLEQTAWYMDHCGDVSEGHLIIFNRDKGTGWDEKIWHRKEEYAGRTVTVWGM